jgi:hypothetical protein
MLVLPFTRSFPTFDVAEEMMQLADIFALWKDTESGGKGEDYTELLRKGT